MNYENPEMINNGRETSPSHRLMRIIRGYNKIVYGDILASAIGLNRMRINHLDLISGFKNWRISNLNISTELLIFLMFNRCYRFQIFSNYKRLEQVVRYFGIKSSFLRPWPE